MVHASRSGARGSLWLFGIGWLIFGLSLTGHIALAQETENSMARSPNKSIVADGLGRLPQF